MYGMFRQIRQGTLGKNPRDDCAPERDFFFALKHYQKVDDFRGATFTVFACDT
jgi:hypothetical protein